MQTRNDKILSNINYRNTIGLEIGALANPIVTPDMGNVRYVDHLSTDVLREKYSKDSSIDTDKIVDVDYIWGEHPLIELTQEEAPFDYLIACHVIEHVPNLVGWLKEINSILKPGGVISLAIPDKYQCFDYNRDITQLGDVLESYLNDRRKPTSRQIFDYLSRVIHWDQKISWAGPVEGLSDLTNLYSLTTAWDITQATFKSNEYYDVHCWIFTPYSFFKLLEGIAELGLLKFEPINFYPTAGCEFFVTLKTVDSISPEKIQEFYSSQIFKNSNHIPSEKLSISNDALICEVTSLKKQITSMENTKFWKMRTLWLKIKRHLKLISEGAN